MLEKKDGITTITLKTPDNPNPKIFTDTGEELQQARFLNSLKAYIQMRRENENK